MKLFTLMYHVFWFSVRIDLKDGKPGWTRTVPPVVRVLVPASVDGEQLGRRHDDMDAAGSSPIWTRRKTYDALSAFLIINLRHVRLGARRAAQQRGLTAGWGSTMVSCICAAGRSRRRDGGSLASLFASSCARSDGAGRDLCSAWTSCLTSSLTQFF
jgi:hypothetical protein